MRSRFIYSVALLFISVSVQAATFGTYTNPFSAQSPWNARPMRPVLGDFEIPKSTYAPTLAEGKWSTGVFLAQSTDKPMTVLGPVDRRGRAVRGALRQQGAVPDRRPLRPLHPAGG